MRVDWHAIMIAVDDGVDKRDLRCLNRVAVLEDEFERKLLAFV